mmetsp:Transcript_37972/g.84846  ORF Transcript_37972/g.84846 Transcript_37972/m.84846 type:complete len:243 (+) Transcript_37972:773-1501(+)
MRRLRGGPRRRRDVHLLGGEPPGPRWAVRGDARERRRRQPRGQPGGAPPGGAPVLAAAHVPRPGRAPVALPGGELVWPGLRRPAGRGPRHDADLGQSDLRRGRPDQVLAAARPRGPLPRLPLPAGPGQLSRPGGHQVARPHHVRPAQANARPAPGRRPAPRRRHDDPGGHRQHHHGGRWWGGQGRPRRGGAAWRRAGLRRAAHVQRGADGELSTSGWPGARPLLPRGRRRPQGIDRPRSRRG